MWWGVVVCVVAVFVNDIDIILTCSLGIQVCLRSREMGRESGGREAASVRFPSLWEDSPPFTV